VPGVPEYAVELHLLLEVPKHAAGEFARAVAPARVRRREREADCRREALFRMVTGMILVETDFRI